MLDQALRLIQVLQSGLCKTAAAAGYEREPDNQRLSDLRLRMEAALSTIDGPASDE